ncbi:MAG: NAD-dependent epimerase/dehydratase family protein [Candidatus Aegiribacteria sp.]|nr:NAD-dependent epimerase/dehydratase family protein [Candidatus Aegiribacteria sp.]MBD3295290.1 NAD-dependent epimerase/dehydratase family protein [Candidatus Fermentibacteria bacterium]
MNYIVTGCAGFIGSHLTDRLLENNNTVVGIDCFRDFYSREIKKKNLEAATQNPLFNLFEIDLSKDDLPDPISVFEGESFILFHLAAQAGVRKSWGSEFSVYIRDNIKVTQRLLEWGLKSEILRNFVFSSSSSVYGNIKELPMKEDSTITRPYSPYGVTKLAAENLVSLYNKNFGLPAVSCRFFTVYGPRQRPDMAFHKFIKAAINEQPITIYGSGEQTRDFTYVSDITDGLIKASSQTNGSIYNLGGGARVSVNQTLKIIGDVIGQDLNIQYDEKKYGDVKDTWASNEKAMNEIYWKPSIDLHDGLSKQFNWYSNSAS